MPLLRAIRSLARTPGNTIACVITLSLGVAASTVIFTLIHSLLLRPLPYPQPDRLAALTPASSWGDILTIEAHSTTVKAAGVYLKRTFGFTDASHAPVEVVLSGMVSHGFFDALELTPTRGARFTRELEIPGANHAMWLTHEFWTSRYQARPDIVGTFVALNDSAYRIAGVLPSGFRFPIDGENPDIYIPLDRADYCCDRDARSLSSVVRLADGVTPSAARLEVSAITANRYGLTGLQNALLGPRKQLLLLLASAAALLMLVATVNAASLLLARAARTLRDAAIKTSLGADLRHLLQEQAAQGLVIGGAAAAAGVALAVAALHTAGTLSPVLHDALQGYSQIADIRMDAQVAASAALLAAAAAIASALAPVTLLRGAVLEQLLREAGNSRTAVRGRNVLIVAQIALCTVLLSAGAGIFDHLHSVLHADKGFRTDQIVIAGIGIPEARYDTDPKMIDFHARVIEKLRAIPGVIDAGGGAGLPIAGGYSHFQFAGQQLAKKDRPRVMRGIASPDLLRILNIPVLHGRGFNAQDNYGHPYVVLVNQIFVARYGGGPGTRLSVGFWNGHMTPWPEVQIVGIVADARNGGIDKAPEPAIYFSSLQIPLEGFLYFVRTTRPAAALTPEFRQAIWSVDPNLQSVTPQPLAPYVEEALESRRLALWLIGSFGVLALVLAAAGLGAGISAWVTESFHELGIRVALGDTAAGVVQRVIGRGLRLTALGLTVGIPAGLAAVRLVSNQVADVGAGRATPLLAVMTLILLTALATSALPALRAARLNPAEVLRRS